MFREFYARDICMICSLNLCTGRPMSEGDNTRCCFNKLQPPDDENIMLDTCRGI